MKNAIILHGKPDKEEYYNLKLPSTSNADWTPWLQGQLLKHDIWAATPEIPEAFNPQWNIWCKEIERFDITPQTILVGHSTGGGFWLRWLSEHPGVVVDKVALVAPSLGYDWGGDEFFAGFTIDPGLAARTKEIIIFNSDNDKPGIQWAVKEIREQLPEATYKEFHLGHFTIESMKTPEFPELLKVLI